MKPSEVTPSHIASAMGMHVSELLEPSVPFESWFRPPEMKPAGKKHRICDIPYSVPKRRLKRLHRFAQRHLPVHGCAHGGVKDKSCYTAAQKHCGRYAIITRDVEDCYPNVSETAFLNELIFLGFRGDTALLLTSLMIVRNLIPQGSPVSGDALNIFLFRNDSWIQSEAAKIKAGYTRSADDMVLSVRRKEAIPSANSILETAIASRGLKVNLKKRDKNGLQVRFAKQLVHNIAVNSKRGTAVSPSRDQKARECAEGFVRGAKAATPTSLAGLAARREQLLGHYHDTRQAKFGPERHLHTQLKIGDQLIIRKIRRLGITCAKDEWWRAGALSELISAWNALLSRLAA
jgi:hypothetical protein